MEILTMLRFAPSPTGDMQLDTLRIAILNYLVAQQNNKHFIVRIEDTNVKENIEGKDTEIMQILEKFALKHDSVSHQSEHLHIHQTLAIKLLEENKAFICTCSLELLEKDKEEARINNQAYTYIGRCANRNKSEHATLKASKTEFVLRLKGLDNLIILRADNTPSYDFSCACEDMLSNISMIIRTDKYLLNTPKQIHIKNYLGYDIKTEYIHIPTLKSSDVYSIKWMLEEGFIPDAILNYFVLLGYSNAPKEIFTLPQAIKWFKLKNVSKLSVDFDIDRLRSINTAHIKMMDDKKLSSLFGFADQKIGQLAKLYLQECSTIKELSNRIDAIFAPKSFEGKWSTEMRILEKLIQDAPYFPQFNDFKSYISEASGLENETFSKALRLLLTGRETGPILSDLYPLLNAYLLEVAS